VTCRLRHLLIRRFIGGYLFIYSLSVQERVLSFMNQECLYIYLIIILNAAHNVLCQARYAGSHKTRVLRCCEADTRLQSTKVE